MFVDPKKIKVSQIINDDYESMILSIYCKKKLKKEQIKEIEYISGYIKKGEIRIDFKFNFEDFVFAPVFICVIQGIIIINLKLKLIEIKLLIT